MHGLISKSLVFLCLLALPVRASIDSVVPITDGVGVEEKTRTQITKELEFRDQDGSPIRLEEILAQGKPVVLAPVYYSCPGMCTLVLNGVLDLINAMTLKIGSDFVVVNVSFDTSNTVAMAKEKAQNYYKLLENQENARSWYFLTGTQTSVDTLMDEIGFRYKAIGKDFSHSSVLVLLEPNGTINRYIYGVNYPAKDVRLALVEASQGKIGNPFDRVLIYCFRYDPRAGKYVPVARNIMKAGGALTILVMAITGFFLWRNELPQLRRQ